jgi:hypothetical protein
LGDSQNRIHQEKRRIIKKAINECLSRSFITTANAKKKKEKIKRKEWIYIGGLFAPSNNNQERLGPSENRASHAHGPLAEDKHFPRVHDVTIFQIGFFISFDLTK